jgi:hypothetical protein
MQDNAPEKIAVCATTDAAKDWLLDVGNTGRAWRQLIVVNETEDVVIKDISLVVETLNNKMYFTAANGTTEEKIGDFDRTVLFAVVPTTDYPVPEAALVGATAGLAAGSFTYKNMILKGIAPQNLTDTQIDQIHELGAFTFVTKAGDNVTTEGTTTSGEYIDIIDSKDYVISQLEYQTQRTLNTMKKVPYDNNGIAILESVAVNVMRDAFNQGIIAVGEDGSADYTVNYIKREETDPNDRVVRRYIGGNFAFALAGAVHTVQINGEIII